MVGDEQVGLGEKMIEKQVFEMNLNKNCMENLKNKKNLNMNWNLTMVVGIDLELRR